MQYLTRYNFETKQPLEPSMPLGVETQEQARAMFQQEPDHVTRNTLIYKNADGTAVCVSHIRFKT